MAKQIITLEIEFTLDKIKSSGGAYPLKAWISSAIRRAAGFVINVEVLNISPVHWSADEDPDEFRAYLIDKSDHRWIV